VNLLDAGHRAADAVVRYSTKSTDLHDAFLALSERGNAEPLARLAPTSLVFGAWDSRDTQAKIPRLIGSTVRAYNVDPLQRAAQFTPALKKSEREKLEASDDFLTNEGLVDVPNRTVGGVIARGGILREALLNFIALRSLAAGTADSTRVLQRYLLGLALVATTAPTDLYFREGCLLTLSPDQPRTSQLVTRTGARTNFTLDSEAALTFANAAAAAFGVGPDWHAEFQPKRVTEKSAAKPKKSK